LHLFGAILTRFTGVTSGDESAVAQRESLMPQLTGLQLTVPGGTLDYDVAYLDGYAKAGAASDRPLRRRRSCAAVGDFGAHPFGSGVVDGAVRRTEISGW